MLETTLGGTCQDQKNGNQPNSTHQLETTSGGTCQDTEIKQSSEQYSRSEDRIGGGGTCQNRERKHLSKGHSLPGNRIGRYLSEHRKKAVGKGALTNWRPHQERLVSIWKESNTVWGTHFLETASGGPCQDMVRK